MTSGIPLTSLQSFQILGTKREEKGFWNVILFDSKEKIQPTSLFNLHIYQPTHPLLFLPPSTSPAAATTPSWRCFSSLDEIEPLWCEHERLHCKMKGTKIWPKADRQSSNTSNTKYVKKFTYFNNDKQETLTLSHKSTVCPLPSVYHCVIAMTGNFEKREAVAKIWSLMLFTSSQKQIFCNLFSVLYCTILESDADYL